MNKVKYVIRQVSVATDLNPEFKNQLSVSYHGKKGVCIAHIGDYAKNTYSYKELDKRSVIEYGYDRIADAKKNYCYKHPENSINWNSNTYIDKVYI